MTKDKKSRFSIKHLPSLIKQAGIAWNLDDPWRLSAVVAYYAILSLPGLLVVIITMLSYIFGTEMIEGEIYSEIETAMGEEAAKSVSSIMKNSRIGEGSWIGTIVGISALVFGATGVFFHLQISINKIWQVQSEPQKKFVRFLIDRTRSFGFVLAIGFLLLISFVISALLRVLQDYINQWMPEIAFYILYVAEIVISLGVISLLFALIFKYLPDVHIGWRSVWVGSIITAVLFTIGKEVLTYYFGKADPGNVYGTAGSIVIILLWVSYSCWILFFGAEFTWIYTKRYGYKFKPKSHAKLTSEGKHEESS
ncbi:MAG: YihY/virulence factor BrkB family protein [Bacteroidota bacterium]